MTEKAKIINWFENLCDKKSVQCLREHRYAIERTAVRTTYGQKIWKLTQKRVEHLMVYMQTHYRVRVGQIIDEKKRITVTA